MANVQDLIGGSCNWEKSCGVQFIVQQQQQQRRFSEKLEALAWRRNTEPAEGTDTSRRRLRMRRCLWHFNKQISVICLSTRSLRSWSQLSDFLIYEKLTRLCQRDVSSVTKSDFEIRFTISFILPPKTISCQNRSRGWDVWRTVISAGCLLALYSD